jgi:hypothetical protein
VPALACTFSRALPLLLPQQLFIITLSILRFATLMSTAGATGICRAFWGTGPLPPPPLPGGLLPLPPPARGLLPPPPPPDCLRAVANVLLIHCWAGSGTLPPIALLVPLLPPVLLPALELVGVVVGRARRVVVVVVSVAIVYGGGCS